jgi:hypothetical protein
LSSRRAPLLALLACACGAEPGVGTVVLAVGDVPDSVQTISVFVRRTRPELTVATATLAVPTRRVSLGVPAEVPLELNAVARSEEPASEALGGRMPVYVARTVRTVPLGSGVFGVSLDAHPGGGLVLVVDGPGVGGAIPLRLVGEADPRPITFAAQPHGAHLARALISGRWGLSSDDEAWVLPGGEGLWVAPGVETYARLALTPAPAPLAPGAPRGLRLQVLDASGAPVDRTAVSTASVAAPLTVVVEAVDEAGAPVAAPDAVLSVRARSTPGDLWSQASAEAAGLPARLLGWRLLGPGRITLEAQAELGDGRRLAVRWAANAGAPGGAPASLRLELAGAETLSTGAVLRADLLDAEGRFAAPAPVTVALDESDPWVFWPDGPALAGPGPNLAGPVARPSGPRGSPVVIRGVATSTAFPGTWTATVTLPGVGS